MYWKDRLCVWCGATLLLVVRTSIGEGAEVVHAVCDVGEGRND